MTTVAAIAAEAFSAVAGEITDAIHACTVTRLTNGAYNPATGAHTTTTSTQTGRGVLDTLTPVADLFPAYIRGPRDQLWLIEGVTSVQENDTLTIKGVAYKVNAVQDIVAAGSLFYAVAQ